jgi:hypothetical protein
MLLLTRNEFLEECPGATHTELEGDIATASIILGRLREQVLSEHTPVICSQHLPLYELEWYLICNGFQPVCYTTDLDCGIAIIAYKKI